MARQRTVWAAMCRLNLDKCCIGFSRWGFISLTLLMFLTTCGLSIRGESLYWFGVRQLPLEKLRPPATESHAAPAADQVEVSTVKSEESSITWSSATPATTDLMCNVFFSEWYWIGWLTTFVFI